VGGVTSPIQVTWGIAILQAVITAMEKKVGIVTKLIVIVSRKRHKISVICIKYGGKIYS